MEELVIEQELPYHVHEFLVTVGDDFLSLCTPFMVK